MAERGDLSNAVIHLAEAVRLLPNGYDRQYNVVDMNYGPGESLYFLHPYAESVPHLQAVLRVQPNHPRANYLMAMVRCWQGETDSSLPFYAAALQADPSLARFPDFYELLSNNYLKAKRFAEARDAAEKGYQLSVKSGRPDQAARLRRCADSCSSGK